MSTGWASTAQSLAHVVEEQTRACIDVYRRDPKRIEEDANNERRIAEGGYRDRQLLELIQNAVDAARIGGRRIHIVLTADTLYVANDGEPFTEDGLKAVMASDLSAKSDDRIGRFGIGFKSVLAVTTSPRIYSRTVSLVFDGVWAEQQIRDADLSSPRYPIMRLARLGDAAAAAAGDRYLAEMFDWASTVVVLPALRARGALLADLTKFRAEFLLFSPHVEEVRLQVLGIADHTVSRVEGSDGVRLREATGTTTWQVASTTWRPSPEARRDAGRIADREEVRLDWAVPVDGRSRARVGEFWAYFPTAARTTMSGLINAPWRLSDDRTNLLPGAFNEALLTEIFPSLVAAQARTFSTTKDPGSLLDLLPARGKEGRSWADDILNDPVFRALQQVACLPDVDGRLHTPSDLLAAPEGVERAWVAQWADSPRAPRGRWVHPACFSDAERRAKVRRLTDPTGARSVTAKEWLEALVHDGDVASSAAAICLAARVIREAEPMAAGNDTKAQLVAAVRQACIIRLEDGDLVKPVRGKVFIRSGPTDASGVFVDPDLVAVPGIKAALDLIGVTVLDRRAELERLITVAREPRQWEQVWPLLRQIPRDVAKHVLESTSKGPVADLVKVRTARGQWVGLGQALLAGAIIPGDGRSDDAHLVDPRFHAQDMDLLRDVGAVSEPSWRNDPPDEAWLLEYERTMKAHYARSLSIDVPLDQLAVEHQPVHWPLSFFGELSVRGRLELTRHLLHRGGLPGRKLSHPGDARLKPKTYMPPEEWLIRKYGVIDTTLGPMPPADAVSPEGSPDQSIFPVVTDLDENTCRRFGVKARIKEFDTERWSRLKSLADGWPEDERRYRLYAYLPGRIKASDLVVRVGARTESVPIANVGVTGSRSVYEGLVEAQVPAMLVDEADVGRFLERWGMHDGKDLLREEVVADEIGEPVYLVDEFPPLKAHPALSADDLDLQLQRCSRIARLVATSRGQVERPVIVRREPGRVLVTATRPSEVLQQVSDALRLELKTSEILQILHDMDTLRASKQRSEVRRAAGKSPEAGLAAAVGRENLLAVVPRQAVELLGDAKDLDDVELARLALSVHGVGVLKSLRTALEERRLDPPREFAGGWKTRQWVTSLGLPVEWAGFPARPSPAREAVDGPVDLKPLHPYQERVTEKIRALLVGIGRQRGVVSLPTGAGKTRVTVQALVEEAAHGRLRSPIMWIAQSDELCEQAAESWSYVWRAKGYGQLLLGRLWGSNEVEEEPDGTQVVIATDAKLFSIIKSRQDDYAWLRDPSVVVVDEAHTSVSPTYTQIFEWLGRGTRAATSKPLIGLTATPFRGTSDEETKRLVARYDGNLLDEGVLGEDPYRTLQEMGVLARVEKRRLDGAQIDFTAAEIAEIEGMQRFPQSREKALGEDLNRSRRVVESILALPEDWPVLLFAPSVENARALAGMLSHQGVPSVAVSANTERSARRHYIDQFRRGDIRVITNYSVLTQGFDAPAVKAVYVCRPTFSPNVYQQMVGRGLRGPKNGGSEKVLIVDVEDNLSTYGDRLAFRAFERLWKL